MEEGEASFGYYVQGEVEVDPAAAAVEGEVEVSHWRECLLVRPVGAVEHVVAVVLVPAPLTFAASSVHVLVPASASAFVLVPVLDLVAAFVPVPAAAAAFDPYVPFDPFDPVDPFASLVQTSSAPVPASAYPSASPAPAPVPVHFGQVVLASSHSL